jgi:hypothetical protein
MERKTVVPKIGDLVRDKVDNSVGLVVLKGKDTMGKRWLKVRVGDKIFVYQSGYAFMGMDEYEDYSDTLEIVSNG